ALRALRLFHPTARRPMGCGAAGQPYLRWADRPRRTWLPDREDRSPPARRLHVLADAGHRRAACDDGPGRPGSRAVRLRPARRLTMRNGHSVTCLPWIAPVLWSALTPPSWFTLGPLFLTPMIRSRQVEYATQSALLTGPYG